MSTYYLIGKDIIFNIIEVIHGNRKANVINDTPSQFQNFLIQEDKYHVQIHGL